ncbi:hypothetical protein GOP47_0003070 [Adiantum capillus-veneris]|uniref:Pentatricopeptide repeat-containing protein n=1 Tax=Adiantum capillus-veneris TaxID=13818 RepID=A0A9D4VBT3_ADICA|nr:hypothetical protein GOP47_0003070 [Adiantum capillus-veneris]
MWKLTSSALSRPRRRLSQNPTILVAFCSTTSMEQSQEDAVMKNAIKLRIFRALESKEEDMARKQLRSFFKLNNVSLLDCNQMLQACWSHVNTQVAQSIWMFMLEKQISLNIYTVACLLHALCRGRQLDEALKLLYKLGKGIDVQPHIDLCSIYLNGCWSTQSASHAEKCLHYIKEKGLKENELVYLELLKLAGVRRDLKAVHKAWSLLLRCCKPGLPSMQSYCAAVRALCKIKSLEEALLTLREMVRLIARNEGFLLSERKLGILSPFNSKEMEHSDEIRKIMEGKEVFESCLGKEPLASGDKIASRDQLGDEAACDESDKLDASEQGASAQIDTQCKTALLQEDAPVRTKGEDEVSPDKSFLSQILGWTRLAMVNLQQSQSQELPESRQSLESPMTWPYEDKLSRLKNMLVDSFNAILSVVIHKRELRLAAALFTQMRAVGLKPDVSSYNSMLTAVVKEKGLQQAFQVVKAMEVNGVQPNTRTYDAILSGFCAKLEVDKAEALLERMLKTGGDQGPSAISFNLILKACGTLDDPISALRVFSKMVEADIEPDVVTVLYLVQAFGRVNFPLEHGTPESHNELARRLEAIETYMERRNLHHNFRTFNTVLAAFSTEGMVDTVLRRLHVAEGCVGGDGLPIVDTVTFNIAITACNRAQKWAAAKDVFNRMLVLGLKPDRETYNSFMNGCAEQRKIADAFYYLDKMHEENLKPDFITYTTLIKVYCYAGDLDAAVKLLRDMEKLELAFNEATFVTLIHCASLKERLDMIEFLVEYMHRKKVQPTISICELVVSAYLNCHQTEDAVEALRVLSMRMLPEGVQSKDILKQICLEDGVQTEESTSELLKDAMIKQGPISEALLAARLSGLGNASMAEWNAEESWWAKRLRSQYIGF